jgi:UDP-N-acetyl-D-galactosamine dehydrogenase
LVGGHCVGVDPYYLTFRAEKAGYHPEVILAGRRINDGVGQRVARECVRRLLQRGIAAPTVTILGVTFKENVPDVRNSKVSDIVSELRSCGVGVQVADPLALPDELRQQYGIELADLDTLQPADAVILAVAHEQFRSGGWALVSGLLKRREGIVIDVKSVLDRSGQPANVELWRL